MTEQGIVPKPPASVTEVLARLDGSADTLPKRLGQCARGTKRHLHLVAVSTVSEMAKTCGVAPSVYMRFCQALGFSGYSEMQALFRANFTDFRPEYEQRLATLREDGSLHTDRLLAEFAEAGHKSLILLSNTTTNDRLNEVSHALSKARVIHLVGLRRAFAVTSNMAYLLEKLRVPVMLHGSVGLLDNRGAILPGDAVFAVTFAPFSEEAIEFANAAAARGIRVFGLSDSHLCPLFDCAESMLVVREDEVGGFRGLNAALTLTTTLAVSIGALRGPVDSARDPALME